MGDDRHMLEAITRDPEVMHGATVFYGTRVPVQTMLDYIENGGVARRISGRISHHQPGTCRPGLGGMQRTSSGVSLKPNLPMKIVLDERVDQRLRNMFAEHDCQTAAYAKLAGIGNGVLLEATRRSVNFDHYSICRNKPTRRSKEVGACGTPFAQFNQTGSRD